MFENILVHDWMTHPAISVAPEASVRLAQQIMHDYQIRHLPVVKAGRLAGMLSSGDIRRAMPSNATSLSIWEIHALWDSVTVGEVMSCNLITVKPDTSMLEAVRLLYENRFNSLPVVDDGGLLVGIVTEVDIYRLLLRLSGYSAPAPCAVSDDPVAALR